MNIIVKSALVLGTIGFGTWFLNNPRFQTISTSSGLTQYEGTPRIIDGDTIEVAGERIRLIGIDTCEMGQPAVLAGSQIDCGAWAKSSVSELVGPREVRCKSGERDIYDRALAVCYLGDRDLNATLVRDGIAFTYRRSSPYRQEEAEAKKAGRGVWLFSDVVDPTDYRNRK